MKKILFRSALLLSATALLVVTGCEKLTEDATETAQSAEDFAEDQAAVLSMMDLVEDVAATQGFMKNGSSILPAGVAINYLDTLFTDGDGVEFEVDLGVYPGVDCGDGKKRYGKLNITASKPFKEVGCVVTAYAPTSLTMYTPSKTDHTTIFLSKSLGEVITLTRTATNVVDVTYKLAFYYVVENPQNPNRTASGYVPMTGTFTLTQVAGMDDPGVLGDEFTISGGTTGQNHNGKAYTTTITENLYRKVDETCSKVFTKGKIELKNDGAKTNMKLDFGDGSCDNDVEITLPGGIKKKYTLK